ncbi:YbaK/prolyl-tRNA synthetase-associated domain protein [Escherichia coli]|nr:YbaK/prolyl-tRNA synthetase-associated domain protein [Escherichia coli]
MTEMAKGSVTHQRLIALLSQEGAKEGANKFLI